MELIFLFIAFIASSFSVFLILETKKLKKELLRIEESVKAPQKSIELQEFLHDLMGGKMGMFAVSRVNTDDLMLRSPRNRND